MKWAKRLRQLTGVDAIKIECRILIGKTEGTTAWERASRT